MGSLADILYPAAELVGIPKAAETRLFGIDAQVDSIDLLSFVTAVEERYQDLTGTRISLVNPKVLSIRPNPFRTLGTLAQYLDGLRAADTP
jgi:acyl carrier protein